MPIFVAHTENQCADILKESAFSLYSVDVNFDNSQSNIGIVWERRSLWCRVLAFAIYHPKWGLSVLSLSILQEVEVLRQG